MIPSGPREILLLALEGIEQRQQQLTTAIEQVKHLVETTTMLTEEASLPGWTVANPAIPEAPAKKRRYLSARRLKQLRKSAAHARKVRAAGLRAAKTMVLSRMERVAMKTTRKVRCPECSKKFSNKAGLSSHIRYVHKKGPVAA